MDARLLLARKHLLAMYVKAVGCAAVAWWQATRP